MPGYFVSVTDKGHFFEKKRGDLFSIKYFFYLCTIIKSNEITEFLLILAL